VEPLAFIEVLGRHGDVLARHPVYRWPAHVGRAYDVEVILDDPYVAPRHVRIESSGDGRFKVCDLQTVNGISVPPASRRIAEAEVGPDELVRLGRTQIRIRPPSYGVQPELRLRATALHRRPAAFAIAAAVLLGMTLWSAWVMTNARDEWASVLFPTLAVSAVAVVWISVWSLVSRTVGRRANFAAHGFVACAAIAAIDVAGTLFEYLSFGFDARWLDRAGVALIGVIAAYMLYRHLRLNSRASRRTLGAIAAGVVLAAFGFAAGVDRATQTMREGMQRYGHALKAPVFLWVSGVTPEAFIAQGEKLRFEADAAARTGR
jgi:multisubunit Na+/H+ antiporter MnhB subunit